MHEMQSPTDCDAASRLAKRPLSFLEAQPCISEICIVRERLLAFGDESGCANFRIKSLHLQNHSKNKTIPSKRMLHTIIPFVTIESNAIQCSGSL
jgi:hypothetical protein